MANGFSQRLQNFFRTAFNTDTFKRFIKTQLDARFDYIRDLPPNYRHITAAAVPLWKRDPHGRHQPYGVFLPAIYILAKHGRLSIQKEKKARGINPFQLAILPTFQVQAISAFLTEEYHYQKSKTLPWPQTVSSQRVIKDYLADLTSGEDSPYLLAPDNANLSYTDKLQEAPTEIKVTIKNKMADTSRWERLAHWLASRMALLVSGSVLLATLPWVTSGSALASILWLPGSMLGLWAVSHALAKRIFGESAEILLRELPWLLSDKAREGVFSRKQIASAALQVAIILTLTAASGVAAFNLTASLWVWSWLPSLVATPIAIGLSVASAVAAMGVSGVIAWTEFRDTIGLSPYQNNISPENAAGTFNLSEYLQFDGDEGSNDYELIKTERNCAFANHWSIMRAKVDAAKKEMGIVDRTERHSPSLTG